MNRRRLLWLGIPLIVLGGIVGTWFWMSQRDTDFVVIGPKTKGVRATFALLETTIDPADYRDCKTVREAIARLNLNVNQRPQEHPFEGDWLLAWQIRRDWLRSDNQAFPGVMIEINALAVPFELPAAKEPITVKQFLRMAYAQSGLPDVAFIVRAQYIEVTTAQHAQEERARYFDSVSVYDRMHNFWKEMTGTVEPDAPDVLFWTVD